MVPVSNMCLKPNISEMHECKILTPRTDGSSVKAAYETIVHAFTLPGKEPWFLPEASYFVH